MGILGVVAVVSITCVYTLCSVPGRDCAAILARLILPPHGGMAASGSDAPHIATPPHWGNFTNESLAAVSRGNSSESMGNLVSDAPHLAISPPKNNSTNEPLTLAPYHNSTPDRADLGSDTAPVATPLHKNKLANKSLGPVSSGSDTQH